MRVMDGLAEMMMAMAIIMVIPMITMMMMVMGDLAEQRGVSTSYIEWNAEKFTFGEKLLDGIATRSTYTCP